MTEPKTGRRLTEEEKADIYGNLNKTLEQMALNNAQIFPIAYKQSRDDAKAELQPKADEKRLLLEAEIIEAIDKVTFAYGRPLSLVEKLKAISEAQDIESYPIGFNDGYNKAVAESQARIQGIFEEIEGEMIIDKKLKLYRPLHFASKRWQVLKQQLEVKE